MLTSSRLNWLKPSQDCSLLPNQSTNKDQGAPSTPLEGVVAYVTVPLAYVIIVDVANEEVNNCQGILATGVEGRGSSEVVETGHL